MGQGVVAGGREGWAVFGSILFSAVVLAWCELADCGRVGAGVAVELS